MSLDVISLDGVEYVKKESLNTMCAADAKRGNRTSRRITNN